MVNERGAAGPVADWRRFLRRARRRGIAADLLRAALAAAVLNEAARWLSVGFIAATGRVIPILDLGPLFLLALVPVLRRRWRPAVAAARVDGSLRLEDRLTTALDFSGRDDVPPGFREAQARETARSLAAVPPASAVPVPRWSLAGPVLLLASLVYPFLFLAAPDTTSVRVARRIAPHAVRRGDAVPSSDEGAVPGGPIVKEPDPTGRRPQVATTEGEEQGSGAGETARGGDPGRPPQPDPAGETARAPQRRPPPLDRREDEARAGITSERVGAALTRVVAPLFSPGSGAGSTPPAPPSGTFAFRIIPKGGAGGPGSAASGTETEAAGTVSVDFDAVPERYRPLVQSYFSLLAAPAERGTQGTQ